MKRNKKIKSKDFAKGGIVNSPIPITGMADTNSTEFIAPLEKIKQKMKIYEEQGWLTLNEAREIGFIIH